VAAAQPITRPSSGRATRRWRRRSAGALERLGLDASREHPKKLTRDTIAASDLAITLGCGEECPYVLGVKYIDSTSNPTCGRSWTARVVDGPDQVTVRRIIARVVGQKLLDDAGIRAGLMAVASHCARFPGGLFESFRAR
jgi:hypothetical protein